MNCKLSNHKNKGAHVYCYIGLNHDNLDDVGQQEMVQLFTSTQVQEGTLVDYEV